VMFSFRRCLVEYILMNWKSNSGLCNHLHTFLKYCMGNLPFQSDEFGGSFHPDIDLVPRVAIRKEVPCLYFSEMRDLE
ncbi:hypothetical protein CHUAL_011116, partial [Chamberlinius hualienensis]